MFQAPTYKILSQELSADENENEFSSSLSSDGSQDSLNLVLIEIQKKQSKAAVRERNQQRRRRVMGRIDGFESYEELIGSAKRRKQFMILGGLCLLAILVIAAIVLSVMLINRSKDENLIEIELDDILKGTLQPKRFNGTWIDDKSFYYFDEEGDFIIYDASTRSKRVAVNHSAPAFEKFISASSYEFSADGKYILIATELGKLYRHSFTAIWYAYNTETELISNILLNSDNADSKPRYRLVKFGPVNAEMIIVDRNNLHYKSSPEHESTQITFDTFSPTSVKYNGVPDWVYEEEVFSSNSATWFSSDGKKIAFIQFDDTNVPSLALSVYGTPGLLQYPELISVQYPKAGAKNPNVKLFSVDLSEISKLNEIPKPLNLEEEFLITSVAWANEKDLISVWTNRVQNKGVVYKCSVDCENVLTLDTENGWIEFYTTPFFNKDGSKMIFIGSNDGYRHIKVLDLSSKEIVSRTAGKYVVTEILRYNKENDVIIYTANTEDDIKSQHVYAIMNEASATPQCLTCNLHENHNYFSAELSENGSYLILTASGPDVPRVDLYTLKVIDKKVELSEHLEVENNGVTKSILDKKDLPKKIYDKITFDDGTESYVMMLLPRNLKEKEKYPMLVEVYGGPDSSSVTNRFSMEWGTYIASSLNIVYVKIDGRGSGLRSDDHLHKLYKHLGTVEVEDQVRTAQKLSEKYPYLDATRFGIWGWSYGGYVSGMSLMRDDDVYKCATSVAPVVDWMLYDSIYTERYMLTPKMNENAYNVSRMTHYVDNITKHNKLYMLVHGTLDDNVHFQQGMVLARVLERSDIQFKEITYPDEDHSLSGVRPHLYHSLEKFFKQCFNLTD